MSHNTAATKPAQRRDDDSPIASTSSTGSGDPPQARRSRRSSRRRPAGSTPGSPAPGQEAKRTAAVILEALAGVRTPASAAQALGITVPCYYVWEERAVAGLVKACQPKPKGPVFSLDRKLAALERELMVARRELARYQALARTAQRALGLPAASEARPAAAARDQPKGKSQETAGATRPKRRRRPTVRALRAARLLRAADPSGADSPITVQSSPGSPGASPLLAGQALATEPACAPPRPAALEPGIT